MQQCSILNLKLYQVIGLGLELDDKGKGLIDWQEVQQ